MIKHLLALVLVAMSGVATAQQATSFFFNFEGGSYYSNLHTDKSDGFGYRKSDGAMLFCGNSRFDHVAQLCQARQDSSKPLTLQDIVDMRVKQAGIETRMVAVGYELMFSGDWGRVVDGVQVFAKPAR